MTTIEELFRKYNNQSPEKIERLTAAGSNRQYYRIESNHLSQIGVLGTNEEENRAFFYLSDTLLKVGVRVPKVFAVDEQRNCYLQQDLGSTALFDFISNGRKTGDFSSTERLLLFKTIRQLPVIQFDGGSVIDYNNCYPQPEFDKRTILWDLNYFKYCFLKLQKIEFSEVLLENDFEKMVERLLSHKEDTFMYRDFQSRNVMINEGEPCFIDFQGGRKGPIYYDVASFVYQAKANFPDDLKEELVEHYLDALSPFKTIAKSEFKDELRHFLLFRTLQVLGAYGFRGYMEKKPHFIESIPFALDSLRKQLADEFTEYPYLQKVLMEMLNSQFVHKKSEGLTVRISSFSYKKGIPQDPTANGGGFVFDCRAIHNPGKYDQYKQLTGREKPVIDFLEQDGEIVTFLSNVTPLVEASVECYMNRDFSDLMVSFGCTGGQHRSVYCAEYLAQYLNKKYSITILLNHREQNIQEILTQ